MRAFSKRTWLSLLIVVAAMVLFQLNLLAEEVEQMNQQDTQNADRLQRMQQKIGQMKQKLNTSTHQSQQQQISQPEVKGLENTLNIKGIDTGQLRTSFKVREPKVNVAEPKIGSETGALREIKVKGLDANMNTQVKPMREIRVKGFID